MKFLAAQGCLEDDEATQGFAAAVFPSSPHVPPHLTRVIISADLLDGPFQFSECISSQGSQLNILVKERRMFNTHQILK